MPPQPRYRRIHLAALAVEVVLSPAVGAGIGFLFDRRYGWFPTGTLIGLVFGGLVAARMIGKIVQLMDEKNE